MSRPNHKLKERLKREKCANCAQLKECEESRFNTICWVSMLISKSLNKHNLKKNENIKNESEEIK